MEKRTHYLIRVGCTIVCSKRISSKGLYTEESTSHNDVIMTYYDVTTRSSQIAKETPFVCFSAVDDVIMTSLYVIIGLSQYLEMLSAEYFEPIQFVRLLCHRHQLSSFHGK